MASSCVLVVLLASIHGLAVDVIPGSEPSRQGAIPLGSVFYSPDSGQVEIEGVLQPQQRFCRVPRLSSRCQISRDTGGARL
jgi:hypothetical protein